MENDRQAGALLLSQLKLVNEATVYFETVIYPAVYKGIYTCINDFVRESGWIGEISAYEDNEDYLWLAPRKWKCTEQQDNNCKQWFESVETENNEDDYTLAVMTGVAVQPGEWGFKTCLNMGEFGGSRKAGAAIKSR
ncbi:hypothetical protein [Edwardsiella ictaluri]|uniref:hypothetical protein n=1 Tax=Edwardsiella ictaluri TaxID=67780 RepID=UPI0018DCFD03|nr:hypothetical protein [Edwardsiella ictaluri]QPW29768.1 hypothetical protein F8539_06970 [Edwardsiella ictaluri]